mgnify:CR=1 FL=1
MNKIFFRLLLIFCFVLNVNSQKLTKVELKIIDKVKATHEESIDFLEKVVNINKLVIEDASDSGSFGRTSSPLISWSIVSLQPAVLVVIIGLPEDNASKSTFGTPSP